MKKRFCLLSSNIKCQEKIKILYDDYSKISTRNEHQIFLGFIATSSELRHFSRCELKSRIATFITIIKKKSENFYDEIRNKS